MEDFYKPFMLMVGCIGASSIACSESIEPDVSVSELAYAGGECPDSGSSRAATHVDNPYLRGGHTSKGYVNPEWRAKAMSERGGWRIASTPTAVWLDRIAAIEGTPNRPMGLRDHLDAALRQEADYIQIVIYNLPGRDCASLASSGELTPSDLPRYEQEFIDPIVAIIADPTYRRLRIINVLEVDSLPNLVTNTALPKCKQMEDNGGYIQGIGYALSKLGALPNTFNYLDAGHHNWLGWDQNLDHAAALLAAVGTLGGMQSVHGVVTNVSNYAPLAEPFIDASATIDGAPLQGSKWISWNPHVGELSYALALRTKLVELGFDAGIGMLIDTSRNGWGGPSRPTAASGAKDVDTFVDESRIDRRIHPGNWCNQSGAGLGERPRAAPLAGIDAYVWIKPPGESDGASREIANDESKSFDRMCDPSYAGNASNGNNATGALPDAPLSGAWFSAQFLELMQNAYPAL